MKCKEIGLGLLESNRQVLLDLAKLLFLVGTIVGFLSPLSFVLLLAEVLFGYSDAYFLYSSISSLIAAFLSMNCYMNVAKGKLSVAGFRGVIAGALILGIAWLAGFLVIVGFLVIIAGVISYIYRTR